MSHYIPYLVVPVLCGLFAKKIILPPLIGFLVSGLILNFMGYEELGIITELGDLGVTLMLFTIGLKINVRLLTRKEVWLTQAYTWCSHHSWVPVLFFCLRCWGSAAAASSRSVRLPYSALPCRSRPQYSL